ncbi:MAG TPA: carboxypeptidase-like regulatory domain-containing protein, partial [Gemmatimonadaceae bacterium]|nr:carboxypeptidase-like regulatory domain-containing protein [Gemmatimonadaceae bacterium]
MKLNRPQLLIVVLAIAAASTAGAQNGPETIKGKITDDSSRAVVASIAVTRGPDRLTQQTTSDSSGNYSTVFEQGTGDYLVYVSAPGYKAARRRVQREGNETVLVANFQLAQEVTTLDAVRVSANRPVRASNNITPTQQNEPGSSEKWNDGVSGAVAPTIAGDLNALAGTMSNVTMGPGGASILGSGSESNLNTLNGMGMSASSIPRAARTETRVTGATFDPTRGGFAGANVDVRLGPGSRNFQRRNAFVTLDPQAWQFSDVIGRALGAPSGGVRASFGADGELIRRALTYNVAMDVAKSSSEPATLLSANADALRLAGVSPDSVARLIAISTPLGLPVAASGVPEARQHSGVAWLGRLDITTDTMKTRALTSYLGFTRDGAIGFGPLSAPSSSGERRERTLGAQLTLGKSVGPGQRILTETRAAASAVKTEVAPYQNVPGANVLVRSTTSDGPDVTALTLGGGSFLSTDDSRWTAEASNETIWNARGRRHRFKTLLWGRADGLEQEGIANSLGSFTFNSIDDFEAGHPASFSRTLL